MSTRRSMDSEARWSLLLVLPLAALILSACSTASSTASSPSSSYASTVAGVWHGELYDTTAGIPVTLTLTPEPGSQVRGTFQYVTHTTAVHGHLASHELTLDVSQGEVLNGRITDGTWKGSFLIAGKRWRFRFAKYHP